MPTIQPIGSFGRDDGPAIDAPQTRRAWEILDETRRDTEHCTRWPCDGVMKLAVRVAGLEMRVRELTSDGPK